MPPSGFNERAIKALIEFLEACYSDLLEMIQSGTSPEAAIHRELEDLRSFMESLHIKQTE